MLARLRSVPPTHSLRLTLHGQIPLLCLQCVSLPCIPVCNHSEGSSIYNRWRHEHLEIKSAKKKDGMSNKKKTPDISHHTTGARVRVLVGVEFKGVSSNIASRTTGTTRRSHKIACFRCCTLNVYIPGLYTDGSGIPNTQLVRYLEFPLRTRPYPSSPGRSYEWSLPISSTFFRQCSH